MTDKFRFGFLICLFLIIGVLSAGCSDESTPAAATPVTTTLPAAHFAAGDIIAKTSSGGETQLYVIRNYDSSKDEYERQWIYKNADGSWGHFTDSRTDRAARSIVDKVYPVTVAHVTLSAIPVVTPAVATPVPTVLSGDAPSVTALSPTSGAKDATVSVSITGTGFQTGAVPKLLQPGSPAVTATGVSVAATKIDCTFNLYGKETGSYNVVVTNPDGQSSTLMRAFTIGEAAPIVSSVTPAKMEINEQGGLVINGQNFRDGVKVVLFRGTAEIPCISPISISGTRISCDLDLNPTRNKDITVGEWDVKVINIEGSQSGTWTKKFTIENVTASSGS
jgi:hypothetical protein